MSDDDWSTPSEPDILSYGPPASSGGGRGKWVAATAAVVAVAVIGAGAAFAAGHFGGGSKGQPEQLIPAAAVGYVSLDLDPSLGQKVDALRFLHKFPAAKKALGSSDDIRQWVFDTAVKDDASLSTLDYDRDVKPWIGDKFGLAVLPAAKKGSDPAVLVVLQVTDAVKAKAGLKKLTKGADGGTCSVSDGYAVCAETSAVLSAATSAAAAHSLADDPTFTGDLKAAGPRGIATAWGDLGKIGTLMPSAADLGGAGGLSGLSGMAGGAGGLGGLSGLGGVKSTGRVVATLRFDGANLELSGLSRGGKHTTSTVRPGTGVQTLPDDTQLAIGVSSDPAAVSAYYRQLQTQVKAIDGGATWAQAEQAMKTFGFHLPGDLNALLGTRFAVAYAGMGTGQLPKVGLRGDASAAQAGRVLDKASKALRGTGAPFTLHHVAASPGYAAALDKAYAEQLAVGGALGSTPAFKAAVPDASSATLVVYANLARVLGSGGLPVFGGASANPNLEPLSALGVTEGPTGDGGEAFHLRVITR